LSIEIGITGVNRIVSRPRTVAEAKECNRLAAVTALAIRLLHNMIREQSLDVPIAEDTPKLEAQNPPD
jgi:hypothetical protein